MGRFLSLIKKVCSVYFDNQHVELVEHADLVEDQWLTVNKNCPMYLWLNMALIPSMQQSLHFNSLVAKTATCDTSFSLL